MIGFLATMIIATATNLPSPTWQDVPARIRAATRAELRACVTRARAPRLRTHRQFAEDELVIPEGKYEGQKLRIYRQPYVGLFYAAQATGRYPRSALLGCVQSGKTFTGVVGPVMYHLFECRESAILGGPTMVVCHDKWRKEIRPAIEKTRYRHLLPTSGPGSRGGTGNLESITFAHGPELKFMSSGGGDETRSSYTARVLVVTEADKMDTAGAASREADPVTQMENRLASYDADERQTYIECTVSIPTGRIWQEYTAGTESRIACPCPHCGEHVTPEREHLRGWQDAETKMEAQRAAYFVCPACDKKLTAKQRAAMNRTAKLVHRGQSIDRDGRITGEPPDTDTLGFRWNAFNNLFWSPGAIGIKEWSATRAADEEAAERELLQFYWAKPWQSPEWDETPLESRKVTQRIAKHGRGIVPAVTEYFSVGIDLGKYNGHLVALAGLADRGLHVPDYQVFDVPSASLGVEHAIVSALNTVAEMIEAGWSMENGRPRVPDRVLIDAGYQSPSVFAFVRSAGRRYLPAFGRGVSQTRRQFYNRPKKTGATVKFIGQEYHISWFPKDRSFAVETNVDWWKSWVHQRLSVPLNDAAAIGAMSFFNAVPREHTTIAKHITNEKLIQEHVPGRGIVERWVNEGRRPNHYLDALLLAGVGLHLAGFRLFDAADAAAVEVPAIRPLGVQLPQDLAERMR